MRGGGAEEKKERGRTEEGKSCVIPMLKERGGGKGGGMGISNIFYCFRIACSAGCCVVWWYSRPR